jgi:DNA-binding response OmpR family regulator
MEKPKLLIVEDDYESQSFLRIFFRNDYDATIVESETDFREVINKKKYDLILMDIALPNGKDGIELTKEIKSNPATSKTPVVCLTAHAFLKDKARAMEAGADYFLTKPVENKILRNVIKQFCPPVSQNQ